MSLIQHKVKIRVGPSGIHIFDSTTGMNVLLDEIRVPEILWAIAPRHVSMALTNSCDLACHYCFAPKIPAALDVELVKNWVCELDKNGCIGVGFGGGEPTLYPALPDLCRFVANYTRLSLTLTTNGNHLKDRLLNALSGNVHFVRISMDGVGATYEALRGQKFSTFRNRLNHVRSLAPFGINYVVNSFTFPDLDCAITLAEEACASEFLLLPEQPVAGKGGIDIQTLKNLQRWVGRYKGKIPLTISEAGSNEFPICNPLASESGISAYAHVDALGILKRSSFENDGVAIGPNGFIAALQILSHKEANP